MDFLALVETALAELEGRGMLAGYAAQAAAKELRCSWQAVLRDYPNYNKATLVADVDHTIECLRLFKYRITGQLKKAG